MRQVFKVPQEHDYDWIPCDEVVPDFLPEDLQEEIIERNKQQRIKSQKDRFDKHLDEEKEDEADMKLPPNQRKRKFGNVEIYPEAAV